MEIKNDELLRQFEHKTEEGNVIVEYSFQERKLFLTKMNVSENIHEETINDVLHEIMQIAEEKRWRVVPTQAAISTFMKKNPTYKDLLPPGIRL
ncbi:MAG: N-acetyltransferase [Flavobacterium sp.]|nr:N-acetyltransferase [Candidatus Neoflavobacterium equi]